MICSLPELNTAHNSTNVSKYQVTLETGLGKKWNQELKEAWGKVYGVVGTTMLGSCPAHN